MKTRLTISIVITSCICMMLLCCLPAKSQVVCPDGIGPVRIGGTVRSLPKTVADLYDRLETVDTEDAEDGEVFTYSICKAFMHGKVVFEFFPEDGKVDNIRILSSNLKTKLGLSLQSTPADLFSAGGFVVENNSGVAGVFCDGALFVDIPMTPSGQSKAEQSYLGNTVSFDVSDFVADMHPSKMILSSLYFDYCEIPEEESGRSQLSSSHFVEDFSSKDFEFTGVFGEEADIRYVDFDGKEMSIYGFPGYVLVQMDPGMQARDIWEVIIDAKGSVVSQYLDAGIFLVRVDVGTESEFISKMRGFRGCQLAFPLIRFDGDSVYYVDWKEHAKDVAFQLGPEMNAKYQAAASINSDNYTLFSIGWGLASALRNDDCEIVNVSQGPRYDDDDAEPHKHYGDNVKMNVAYVTKMREWYNYIGNIIRNSRNTSAPVVITAGNQFMHFFEYVINGLSPETKQLLNSRLFIVCAEQAGVVPYSNALSTGRIPGVITVNINNVTNYLGQPSGGTSLAAPRFVRYVWLLVEISKLSGHPLSFQEAATLISDRWRESDLSSITPSFFSSLLPVNYTAEAIDLGLSVKWASYNVGASRPEEFGNYFAWGEIYPDAKHSASTYKYYTKEMGAFGRYKCSKYNYSDNVTVLELDDDAARFNWGGKWRMPTVEEWNELLDPKNCKWTQGTLRGVEGYFVTSNKPGYTDRSIFLPGAGSTSSSGLGAVGQGHYWSSSWSTSSNSTSSQDEAYYMYFIGNRYLTVPFYRYFGRSVRPVCP